MRAGVCHPIPQVEVIKGVSLFEAFENLDVPELTVDSLRLRSLEVVNPIRSVKLRTRETCTEEVSLVLDIGIVVDRRQTN
jgi:hypothetical protein